MHTRAHYAHTQTRTFTALKIYKFRVI